MKLYLISILLSLLLLSVVRAQETGSDWSCVVRHSCQACLDDNINDPVCQPFGTRQLLRCSQRDAPKEDSILAWHACGRLASEEKKGFLKFVSLNIALMVTATVIVIIRSKQLANAQYDRLAKTIGLPDIKSPDGPIAAAGRLLKFLRT